MGGCVAISTERKEQSLVVALGPLYTALRAEATQASLDAVWHGE